MTIKNIFQHRLVTKLLLSGFAFTCLLTDAQAENKVTIDDFNIKPGEEKTIAVYLDNDDAISALQLDIELPQGLYYVSNSVTRNEERIDRDTHSLYMKMLPTGNLRLLIAPSGVSPIAGHEGAVAYFTVEASSNFVREGEIALTDILGSNSEKDETTGFTKKFEMDDYSATVAPLVGKFYASPDTVAIKTDSTAKRISVVLDNYVDIRSMQASITLPKGLTYVMKENSDEPKPKFEYGARLPQNVTISSNFTDDGRLKVAIAGLTDECFADTTGEVFAFYVKADTALAEQSEILFSEAVVADRSGNSFGLYDEVKLPVTNAYVAHYTPALQMVEALRSSYAAAVDTIAAQAANVKDNEDIVAAQQAISAQIDSLQQFVDEAYQAETLAGKLGEVETSAADIEADIKALVEKALADQANVVAANEAAYTRLTGVLDTLQAQWDAAKETLTTECPDVANLYTPALDSLQTQITALRDSVKADYDAMKLTAESTIDSVSVAAGIEKVLADATQAQATVTENLAAYNRLTGVLDTLQAQWDAAKETLTTECPDVANLYTPALDSLQTQITALRDSVKADYDAMKLTAESTIDSVSVAAGIEKVLADAAQAQAVVTENNEAYARLTAELSDLQAKLDEAVRTVNTDYKDVADQFEATMDSIQTSIQTLKEGVDAAYEAVELTAESSVDTQSVEEAIAKLLADAAEAQNEFTGISNISINDIQDGAVEIYDLTGKRQNTLVKGKVNIIKHADGKVYKLFVK